MVFAIHQSQNVCRRKVSTNRRRTLRRLRNSVGFDESDAGSVVLAADDRSIVTGRGKGDNNGFAVVARRKLGGDNGLWLSLFPVVVEGEDGAVLIVQFKRGIEQRSRNAGLRES